MFAKKQDTIKNIYFLVNSEGWSVGMVNTETKSVCPCHGWHYPNPTSKALMKYAKKLGYRFYDYAMPNKVNKTINSNNQ